MGTGARHLLGHKGRPVHAGLGKAGPTNAIVAATGPSAANVVADVGKQERRGMRWLSLGATVAAALMLGVPLVCGAQVIRCTDPVTGSVTYTDGSCTKGQASREVAPRQTPEEIQRERDQAEQALRLRNERREAEALHDDGRVATPAQRSATDPASSPACQQARQALQRLHSTLDPSLYDTSVRIDAAQRQADLACLTPSEYARMQSRRGSRPAYDEAAYIPPVVVAPPRPRPPQRQREMVQCNVFRCYDRQGNSYPH